MESTYKFDGLSAIETEAILGSSKRQGVFVPAILVRRLNGDAGAAMILAQMFWWVREVSNQDGWFYKTGDRLRKETGLGRRAQDRGIKRLVELKLMEKKVAGLPAKRWFRVNLARYLELINRDRDGNMALRRHVNVEAFKRCPSCKQDRPYIHGHHIIPRQYGGNDNDANITSLCTMCHITVHNYIREKIRSGLSPCRHLFRLALEHAQSGVTNG